MEYIIHKVKEGENIESISAKYLMEKNEFISINNLNFPGEKLYTDMLVIVESPLCGKYKVKPLETLDMIADKFNIDIEKLREMNPNKCTFLFAGEIIRLE